MRAIRTALFAITFLFLTNHVAATDYFVATTGSNSNNGLSSSTPFQTITKAVSVLASGDTAWVASGEYNETVVIWNKNNIALYGYGSTKPIIDGTGVTMNNGLVEIGGSTSPGTNGVIFEGFEVRDSAATGILIWEAKNVQLRYNYVHRNQKGGITAGASTWGRNDYITVFENTVTDNVRNNSARTLTSGWSQGIGLMYTDHGTIEGNYVSKNFGEGIDYISSDNGLIVRNEVWDNYSVNVYLDNAQTTVVDRNWIYNSGDTNFYRNTRPASGITA
ncbi:MAG TPA: right-handed parallel beta-helix repeat-containing protein, partial [Thermoanaerobaculia bacterium]|nr:right-handed parallel beta-helix repeat-containing protein [Thermoanaerobaculia bacterium]